MVIRTKKEYVVITEDNEVVMRGSISQIAEAFGASETKIRNIVKEGEIVTKGVFKGLTIYKSEREIASRPITKKVASNTIIFDSEVLPGKSYIVAPAQRQITIKGGITSISMDKVKELTTELTDIVEFYGDERLK